MQNFGRFKSWEFTTVLADLQNDDGYSPGSDPLIVKAIEKISRNIDGLSADSPDEYLDFVASDTTKGQMRREMLTMSSCALATMGLWRHCGLTDDRLWKAYVLGQAVAWVVAVARNHGAWISLIKKSTYVPQAGDTVLVQAPEHVFTLIDDPKVSGDVIQVDALHGGQVTSAGKQLIKVKPTKLVWKNDRLTLGQRTVAGVARGKLLRPTLPALLPPDWLD